MAHFHCVSSCFKSYLDSAVESVNPILAGVINLFYNVYMLNVLSCKANQEQGSHLSPALISFDAPNKPACQLYSTGDRCC